MRDPLPAFLRHLADRRSTRTQKTYGAVVASFLAFAAPSSPEAAPTRAALEAFLSRPRRDGTRRAPAGRNQELAALRAFAAFAKRDLGWTTDPTDGVPVAREPRRDPVVLSAGEVRAVFLGASAEADTTMRARNLAALALLANLGLRVGEVVGLDVAQVDLLGAKLVAVRCKGGVVRDVPLSSEAVVLVASWLYVRSEAAAECETALFVSARGTRASIRSVQRLMVTLRALLPNAKRATPHTLRHSAATIGLESADLSTIADLLGHEDVNTTRKYYLHLVDRRVRDVVSRLGAVIPPEVVESAKPLQVTAREPAPETGPAAVADAVAAAGARRDNVRRITGPLDAQRRLDDSDRQQAA